MTLTSDTPASAGSPLNVFAGSASKPPLDECSRAFEKQTGTQVFITYGGSGSVLSQMELSKSGDVYIPGSPDFLLKSESKNITYPTSTKILAYLIPAISVQPGNPKNIQSLSDLAKAGITVGIGNPSSVCVGLYAVEVLNTNGLLEKVYPNIVTQADSCDKTATLIALKSVDAVMGWDVFHFWNPQFIETVYIKAIQLPRIAYIPAAISTYTQNRENAQRFIDFLVSERGQEIFKKWGYSVTESAARQYAPQAQIGGEYQIPELFKQLSQ